MESDDQGPIELPGSWDYRRQFRAMKSLTAKSETGHKSFTFRGRMSVGRVSRLIEDLEDSGFHAWDVGRYPGTDYRLIAVSTPETSPPVG